jgi:hypothetical protein
MQGASIVELTGGAEVQANLKRLEGERVTVRGAFLHTHIPHYHPELIMLVESVSVANDSQ